MANSKTGEKKMNRKEECDKMAEELPDEMKEVLAGVMAEVTVKRFIPKDSESAGKSQEIIKKHMMAMVKEADDAGLDAGEFAQSNFTLSCICHFKGLVEFIEDAPGADPSKVAALIVRMLLENVIKNSDKI